MNELFAQDRCVHDEQTLDFQKDYGSIRQIIAAIQQQKKDGEDWTEAFILRNSFSQNLLMFSIESKNYELALWLVEHYIHLLPLFDQDSVGG